MTFLKALTLPAKAIAWCLMEGFAMDAARAERVAWAMLIGGAAALWLIVRAAP